MKAFLMIFLLVLVSCASSDGVVRNKMTDKSLRVMVDPESFSVSNYVRIQTSLVRDSRFSVVDRSKGIRAVKREQESTYQRNRDRFSNREKYSHWGKLYGVGAIITGHVDCYPFKSFWNKYLNMTKCDLYLNMVDSNTGEVVVGIKASDSFEYGYHPDWKEAVSTLSMEYPKHFTKKKIHERLEYYKMESEEEYIRHEEKVSQKSSLYCREAPWEC